MTNLWLTAADWFFLIFHSVFTLFNISGWIFRKTRKLHLASMALTSFSWFFLGIWYDFGYCFCTDWHWQVRMMLGTPIRSHSYIHFLIQELSGINLNPDFVDTGVIIAFIIIVLCTVTVNMKDYLISKSK